jgi:ABC-type multidrug transport system permease subunit
LILQVLIEIPLLVQAFLFGIIVYAMIGLEWTAKKFFWWYYYVFFSYAYFTYYGMMSVGLTPNHQIAAVVAGFFYQVWNLFSGYLITRVVSQLLFTVIYDLSPFICCDSANMSCRP